MKQLTTIIFLLITLISKANDVKVVTYNVNYFFVHEKVVDYVKKIDADIVFLQEVTKDWEAILRPGLKQKYEHVEFKTSSASGGLAIFSKYPILKLEYIRNKPGWFRSALITVQKDEDTLQFLHLHLKPPLTEKGLIGWKAYRNADEIHVEELKHFTKHIKPNLPTMILGDFNENDGEKSSEYLEDKGYTNALPLFDKRSRTWRFIFLRGRYDHIFFNDKFTCTKAKVIKLGRSDHFPVYGEFKIN